MLFPQIPLVLTSELCRMQHFPENCCSLHRLLFPASPQLDSRKLNFPWCNDTRLLFRIARVHGNWNSSFGSFVILKLFLICHRLRFFEVCCTSFAIRSLWSTAWDSVQFSKKALFTSLHLSRCALLSLKRSSGKYVNMAHVERGSLVWFKVPKNSPPRWKSVRPFSILANRVVRWEAKRTSLIFQAMNIVLTFSLVGRCPCNLCNFDDIDYGLQGTCLQPSSVKFSAFPWISSILSLDQSMDSAEKKP